MTNPKAFLVTESEILDTAVLAAYTPTVGSAELAAVEPQRAKAYRIVRQYIVETPA